jgi:hypothetical protein
MRIWSVKNVESLDDSALLVSHFPLVLSNRLTVSQLCVLCQPDQWLKSRTNSVAPTKY